MSLEPTHESSRALNSPSLANLEPFLDMDLANVPALDLNQPESHVLGYDDAALSLPCFLHPDHEDCGCQESMSNWDLAPSSVQPQSLPIDEPDYTKFENWIPRFVRPDKPCDYCRSRRLQCYLQRGDASCTACNSLFRECSLTNSHTLEASNYPEGSNGVFLDTLHIVDENMVKDQGTLTGIKPLISKSRTSGTSTPINADDAPGSSKRNGLRFPRHAIKILRDWLDAHACHPYPTEEEKAELERQTELKPIQIVNWLANARRRRKAGEKPKMNVLQSPSLGPTTSAITIPRADKPWDELNPLERWKHSPPENEPALMTDIVHAVVNNDLPQDQQSLSTSSRSSFRKQRSSNDSAVSVYRAASTTSADTSKQSSSITVSSAAFSHGSSKSHGSFGSFGSGLAGKKDRRRRKRPTSTILRKPSDDNKKRPFQCTFCTDTFKSKYDWTRHEKSLHLSLEKWICAPLGPATMNPNTDQTVCVYCNTDEPGATHLETHNHHQCEEKGLEARTFYRKDHLRQHLRLMHGCEMMPHMDTWKVVVANINSRCGFCAQRFTVWQERVDHLTAHFKAGARMSEWRGCRGLDPGVAAQVTNAMPPYLIGIESVSPVPFSATNRATWRQIPAVDDVLGGESMLNELEVPPVNGYHPEWTTGTQDKATCWEILTVRLARWATEQARQGIVMTDEMLQRQARRILYDSDDTWNQTAADNPEWLDLFKKAHGLDLIPKDLGGQGSHVPEDLEWYGDLGLRVPFAVQLAAYNNTHVSSNVESQPVGTDPTENPLDGPRLRLKTAYTDLAASGLLYDDDKLCGHADCINNVVDITSLDGRSLPGPRDRRYCSQKLSPDQIRLLDELRASLRAGTELQTTRSHVDLTSELSPPYARRYKCVLPDDVARRFATMTSGWGESGDMPVPRSTTNPNLLTSTPITTNQTDGTDAVDVMDLMAWPVSNSNVPSFVPTSAAFNPASAITTTDITLDHPLESRQEINMTPEMMLKSLDELLVMGPAPASHNLQPASDEHSDVLEDWSGPSNVDYGDMVNFDLYDSTFDEDIFSMQLDDAPPS